MWRAKPSTYDLWVDKEGIVHIQENSGWVDEDGKDRFLDSFVLCGTDLVPVHHMTFTIRGPATCLACIAKRGAE